MRGWIAALVALSLLFVVNTPTCAIAMAEPHSANTSMSAMATAPSACNTSERHQVERHACVLFSCWFFVHGNQSISFKPRLFTVVFESPAQRLIQFDMRPLSPPI